MKKILAVAVAAVGLAAVAAPKVTIDKIENGDVWSTKKVTYTVSDLSDRPGGYKYNLAFDVTAYSVTTNIKKGAAQNGTFTETFDTAAIFGEARKDPKAKIRVSLEKGSEIPLPGVQLWENGPYFAECNVGATKPEEPGYYFWWGDTVGYVRNGNRWDAADGSVTGFSFKSENCPTYGKTIEELYNSGDGYIDAISENVKLKPQYDAATAHLGAPWRMMTKTELDALVENCTITWTYRGGVYGCLVSGKEGGAYASNQIFLPAAGSGGEDSIGRSGTDGFYWSSTPYADSKYAWYLSFGEKYSDENYQSDRFYGFPVRPVR